MQLASPSAPQRQPRQPRSEEERVAQGRLPDLLEHDEMALPNGTGHISSGSDEDSYPTGTTFDSDANTLNYTTPSSTISGYTPTTGFSSGFSSWNSMPRPRGGSASGADAHFISDLQPITTDLRQQQQQQRPSAPLRTPQTPSIPHS
jgi:hypothetical protein